MNLLDTHLLSAKNNVQKQDDISIYMKILQEIT